MKEFERVLQQCLQELEQGASDVEECLRRHPQHAAELEPVLLTSVYLARGREARLSPAFKARVRTRLIQQMYTRPRRPARSAFGSIRLAASLAVVMFALLAAGTGYAQRALPGQSFYDWKIASENAWRMVSPDPLGTDLLLAERRLEELTAVRNNPVLQEQVLAAYFQVIERLKAQVNVVNEQYIQAVLDAQAKELNQLGVLPTEPTPNIVPTNVVPTFEAPVETSVTTPLPVLETPQVNLTELPPLVPEIRPTSPDLPKPNPTIEIPSLIP
jgi:hypothetical protein